MNTKFITTTLILAVSSNAVFPLVASAALPQDSSRPVQNFCVRLSTLTERVNTHIDGRMEGFDMRKDQRLERADDRRENRDNQRYQQRTEWDENRNEHYTKLSERATTQKQKDAVVRFQTTMEQLVKTRRDAVDQSHRVFRTGVDKAIETQKASVENALATFKTASDSALAKAKADCDGGRDPRVVREEYQAAVEGFRKNLQENRKKIEKVRISVEPLVKARKVSVDNALDAFKVGAEKARKEFQAALRVN